MCLSCGNTNCVELVILLHYPIHFVQLIIWLSVKRSYSTMLDISRQTWALVLPGSSLPVSTDGDSMGLLTEPGKVVTYLNNLYLRTMVLTDNLRICVFSDLLVRMDPRDRPSLCKSAVLLLRSSLSSFDFPIVLSSGSSNECCQTNLFMLATREN